MYFHMILVESLDSPRQFWDEASVRISVTIRSANLCSAHDQTQSARHTTGGIRMKKFFNCHLAML